MKKLVLLSALLVFQYVVYAQWTKLTKAYPQQIELEDISIKGANINAVATDFSNFQGVTFHSGDSGATWDTTRPLQPGFLLKTISFKDPDTGIIGGYGSYSVLAQTTNSGKSWYYYLYDTVTKGINSIVFMNDKIGFAAGYGQTQFFSGNCYRTYDGGHNWQYSAGIGMHPLDTLGLDYIDFLDVQSGYALNNGFGRAYLMKTTDTGKNWSLVYTHDCSIGGIFFWNISNGIMTDVKGRIFKTSDAGLHWTAKTVPTTTQLSSIVFADNINGYAVGDSGTILKTVDGGNTWTKELSPVGTLLTRVRYYAGYAYAVGDAGVVLRSAPLTAVPDIESLNNDVNIYPNPATSILYVSSARTAHRNIKAQLFNLSGQEVITATTQNGLLKFNVVMLVPGIYTLLLQQDGIQSTMSVLIQH